MGNRDISQKNLIQYTDVFSDIVNALLYGGKPIVKEENLHLAPTETFYRISDDNWHQQFQDVSMYENRDGQIYVQYTIENQTKADNQMVLRQAGYEGGIYRRQYNNNGSFGVISIVLYWGEYIWDPIMDLHMFLSDKEYPDNIKQYIDNHVMHVFNMQCLPLDIRKRFHSDMRIVVDYLAEKENYQPTSQKIKHLEAFLFMMQTLTKDNRFISVLEPVNDKRTGGSITMCELIDRYINQGISLGISQGISEGISQGMSQGAAEAVIQVLLCRGIVSRKLQDRINSEKDIDKLKKWITLAVTSATAEEFEENM